MALIQQTSSIQGEASSEERGLGSVRGGHQGKRPREDHDAWVLAGWAREVVSAPRHVQETASRRVGVMDGQGRRREGRCTVGAGRARLKLSTGGQGLPGSGSTGLSESPVGTETWGSGKGSPLGLILV